MFRKATFVMGFKCQCETETGINRSHSSVILSCCYLFKNVQRLSGWVRWAITGGPAGFITSWKLSWLIQTLLRTLPARNLWNVDPFYNPCVSFFLKAVVGTIALSVAISKWQSSSRLFPWWGRTGTGSFVSSFALPGCWSLCLRCASSCF